MHESIINQLEAALDETVQLLSRVTREGANKVPFEGSWTAAQVAQHLYLSEKDMDELMHAPGETVARQPDENAVKFKAMMLDFDLKMESPEYIVPEDKEYDTENLIQSLKEIKNKALRAVKSAKLEETAALPDGHPLQGSTKLEMVHFLTYHTMRHNHQIQKVIDSIQQSS